MVGEKRIYRSRAEDHSPSIRQDLPKRLHFAMDVSASMYRFNDQV